VKSVLIVGCGDIGRRVARLSRQDGCAVTGLVRSAESAASLREAGIEPVVVDLDDCDGGIEWRAPFEAVYYFAPPPSVGEADTRLRVFLQSLNGAAPVLRIVYISTSAVYGDCNGAWISEEQPLCPGTARGRRRLSAEVALRNWTRERATDCVILRVPGIYGPGRLPLERLRKGIPVLREADAPYTNRIHADDLARVCVAAMKRGRAGAVYNVSDGHPGTMTEYFFRIADIAGLQRPSVVSLEEAGEVLSPGMLSFLSESRRLDNRRMREELGIEPDYPDLSAGLPSCMSAE
jgi:nucleoside-diphosphate-sugar epimerase